MRRKVSTFITACGIALVVAVFMITMSLSEGIRTSLGATGVPLNVHIMRQGSTAETTSFISKAACSIIKYLDGIVCVDRSIAAKRSGLPETSFVDRVVPLVAPETLLLINIPKKGHTIGSNVLIRGVTSTSFLVHPEVTLTSGRMFRPGLREVIVSDAIAGRYQNCEIGNHLKFGKDYWTVVGHFTAGKSAFNSELWGDVIELSADFDRQQYSSVTVRAVDDVAAARLIKRIADDPQLSLKAQSELAYYKQQTVTALPIQVLGSFMATVMAIGACFAAMNTMYAAVSARVKEIGTLRVLGFKPSEIRRAFVMESLLLSLVGGVIGCAIAMPLNGLATGTANWNTFSELTFEFTITPALVFKSLLFAVIMGLAGGYLPARSASRKSIISTLKEL